MIGVEQSVEALKIFIRTDIKYIRQPEELPDLLPAILSDEKTEMDHGVPDDCNAPNCTDSTKRTPMVRNIKFQAVNWLRFSSGVSFVWYQPINHQLCWWSRNALASS